MAYFCGACKKELTLLSPRPGRRDSCPHCGADLHACINCHHFDATRYNECAEPSADRVVKKNASNFCDFFKFSSKVASGTTGPSPKEQAMKKLDDLFKK